MALTVAPTAGYNSYISLADANAYHADRATPAWADADGDGAKSAALIRATDYIDANYTFSTGPLVDGVVNPLVEKAVAVMAVYALSNTLAEARDERGIVESYKEMANLGVIDITYDKNSRDKYPAVTAILAPIASLKSGGMMVSGKLVKPTDTSVLSVNGIRIIEP